MLAIWNRANLFGKWIILTVGVIIVCLIGARTGLLSFEASPARPLFNEKACQRYYANKFYRGLSLIDLADDVALDIRNRCSKIRILYEEQG